MSIWLKFIFDNDAVLIILQSGTSRVSTTTSFPGSSLWERGCPYQYYLLQLIVGAVHRLFSFLACSVHMKLNPIASTLSRSSFSSLIFVKKKNKILQQLYWSCTLFSFLTHCRILHSGQCYTTPPGNFVTNELATKSLLVTKQQAKDASAIRTTMDNWRPSTVLAITYKLEAIPYIRLYP